jgi:hypothetical protein
MAPPTITVILITTQQFNYKGNPKRQKPQKASKSHPLKLDTTQSTQSYTLPLREKGLEAITLARAP